MDDMISRKAAINALIRKRQPVNNGDGTITVTMMTDEVIRDVLNELPSVQPQRWIPVTEALPDRGKIVLITNDKGNVRSGRFRGVELWKDDGVAYWTFKGNTVEHVLAWMPLPEPYTSGADMRGRNEQAPA